MVFKDICLCLGWNFAGSVKALFIVGLIFLFWGCDIGGTDAEEKNTFQKVLFTGDSSNSEARAIARVTGGGYMIAGRELGKSLNSGRPYVARLNKKGDIIWKKYYSKQQASSGGAYDMVRTSDDNYVITGKVSDALYLLKIDSNGNTMWQHRYHRINSSTAISQSDVGFGLTETKNGGFVIVGRTLVPIEQTGEGWLVPSMLRVDAQGNDIWFNEYRDVVDRGDAYAVTEKSDGTLQAVGRPFFQFEASVKDGNLFNYKSNEEVTYEDIKCLKDDNSCFAVGEDPHSDKITITKSKGDDILWSKTLRNGVANALTITQDNGIVGVGIQDNPNAGGVRSYMFKLAPDGKLVWDLVTDTRYSGELFDVIETNNGDIVATGQTTQFRKGQIKSVIIRATKDGEIQ